jgi:hypothetical protein
VNPSYLLLRRPFDDAIARYGAWIDLPEVEPRREVAERDAIDLALDGDDWKGLAVFVFSSGDWTVFEELSGGLGSRPAEDWLRLADGGDLIYIACNDAIGYGELVQVNGGKLVRQFLQDEQDPSGDVSVGQLPDEEDQPIVDWTDIAFRLEEREEDFTARDRGWLWIHQFPD